MKINIRDDDTNFFTKPEEIDMAYENRVSDLKVTLACIPFVTKHSFIMEGLPGSRQEQYIELNRLERTLSYSEFGDIHKLHPLGDNNGFSRVCL